MRALFLFLLVLCGSPVLAVGVGEMAPDFTFERTWNMGNEASLSQFRGKVVLLEFWASW